MPQPFSHLFDKKKPAIQPTVVENSTQFEKKENPLIIALAVLIAAIVGASLWVSVSALMEKVRLSHELQQIIEIVAAADDAAANHHLDPNIQEDLLANLARVGHIVPTGEMDGYKTLSNPWGGIVFATSEPGGHIRIETVAPSNKCRRVIDLFDQNLKPLGLEQIAIKDATNIWHNIYADAKLVRVNDMQMAILCDNPVQADIILTFSLH